jgi:hypothetical protein
MTWDLIHKVAQEDRQVHRGRRPQCPICKLPKVERKEEDDSQSSQILRHQYADRFFTPLLGLSHNHNQVYNTSHPFGDKKTKNI